MEKLDLYILALKNMIQKLEDKDSPVYQTLMACLELAVNIKKDSKVYQKLMDGLEDIKKD
jgi:formiminotetrahydrofolate cyclodeaminase